MRLLIAALFLVGGCSAPAEAQLPEMTAACNQYDTAIVHYAPEFGIDQLRAGIVAVAHHETSETISTVRWTPTNIGVEAVADCDGPGWVSFEAR